MPPQLYAKAGDEALACLQQRFVPGFCIEVEPCFDVQEYRVELCKTSPPRPCSSICAFACSHDVHCCCIQHSVSRCTIMKSSQILPVAVMHKAFCTSQCCVSTLAAIDQAMSRALHNVVWLYRNMQCCCCTMASSSRSMFYQHNQAFDKDFSELMTTHT